MNLEFFSRSVLSCGLLAAAMVSLSGCGGGGGGQSTPTAYVVTPLTTNVASSAPNVDANLVNPWGIASFPGDPLRVADNGSSLISTYNGSGQVGLNPLSISGGPTGIASNTTTGFQVNGFGPAQYIACEANGAILAWNSTTPPTSEVPSSTAVYTGDAVGQTSSDSVLYAANFGTGYVDQYIWSAQTFKKTSPLFDGNVPSSYYPYNVMFNGGKLYVAFAAPGTGSAAMAGLHAGYVDVFAAGSSTPINSTPLIARGPLNAPWGMTIAPSGFGQFSGDLLVANQGDGAINAFDPNSGAYKGTISDGNHNPIVVPGIWGLIFGNGTSSQPSTTLYFTAGSAKQGELGSITVAS